MQVAIVASLRTEQKKQAEFAQFSLVNRQILDRSSLKEQALLIASSASAIWKLTRLEGFGNRFKVQDYANGDAWRGDEVKLSAPTAGEDDRTDDCASGADDVAGPAKVQISTFSNDR
jgi:hypothetical protein